MTKAPPPADPTFAPARVEADRRDDGTVVLRSPMALGPYPDNLGAMLSRQAKARPQTVFFAEREGEGWRRVTYSEALARARSIAQALCARGLGPERPVMVLSGNSVNHGLLMLGAFLAGVPIAPVSPAYSLMSRDFAKLRHVFDLVGAGMIYVEALAPFAAALKALDAEGVELVTGDGETAANATAFAELLADTDAPAPKVDVGPDTVAKYLFTSGSTGLPKGVINTHRMLASNQQMIAECWPFVTQTPPVLVDWLPWNHTFGGNFTFNLVLNQGGTLYIDGGKPLADAFETTARNLTDIASTIHFNVPAGFAMLVPRLERDAALRERFFKRLQMIFYAGAALSQDLWDRLVEISTAARGRPVTMISAWGSTETAPMATTVHYPIPRAGNIGLPAPGVEIKMVPAGDKMELRVRGPCVTPGYLGRPDLTRAAFDEEGFYKIGDAGRLADPDDPAKGLLFDGRVAEDFKLTTGTWVHAGNLRVKALAHAAPALLDAVVCGHDREFVGLLAWPNVQGLKTLANDAGDDPAELVRAPGVVAHIRDGLAQYNRDNPGSSTRIARVLLMTEPPSIDANEITDKGYVNQRATLERRADLVERLYADPPGGDVIVI